MTDSDGYRFNFAKIGSGMNRMNPMIHFQYQGQYTTARGEIIAL